MLFFVMSSVSASESAKAAQKVKSVLHVTVLFEVPDEAALSKFLRIFQSVVTETRREAGNLAYDLTQDVANPLHFILVERWISTEVLDLHFKEPHMVNFFQDIKPLNLKIVVHKSREIIF